MAVFDLMQIPNEYIVAAFCAVSAMGLRQEDFYKEESKGILITFAHSINPKTLDNLLQKEKKVRARYTKEHAKMFLSADDTLSEEFRSRLDRCTQEALDEISEIRKNELWYRNFIRIIGELASSEELSSDEPIVIKNNYGGKYNFKVNKGLVVAYNDKELEVCYTDAEKPKLDQIIESLYNQVEDETLSENE